jgi:hypothetical protein
MVNFFKEMALPIVIIAERFLILFLNIFKVRSQKVTMIIRIKK